MAAVMLSETEKDVRRSECYEVLGLSSGAPSDQVKQAYLKLVLKWHPQKNPNSKKAEKKLEEVTEAYEILCVPTIRKLGKDGHVMKVILDQTSTTTTMTDDTSDGTSVVQTKTSWFRFFGWLKPSYLKNNFSVSDRLDDAYELMSEYMYDGDLGDFFKDADDNLHVIVSIPLARALIGGKITYNIPADDTTEPPVEYVEEISGILDGFWRPMKRITVNKQQVWIIFRVILPKDMTEEEEIELRRKLLFAQTTSAILPPIINWISSHPKTMAFLFSTLVGGGALWMKKWSWTSLAMRAVGWK